VDALYKCRRVGKKNLKTIPEISLKSQRPEAKIGKRSTGEREEMDSKSDSYLVEVLRGEDEEEIKQAETILFEKYFPQLTQRAAAMLKREKWIEPGDVARDILLKFFEYVKTTDLNVGNVKSYLMKMTKNKCLDELEKWKKEINFENDIPLREYEAGEGPEENLEKAELQEFVRQLPFTSPLTDCQRVVFALQGLYLYPPRVVARLMGKGRRTVYTHYYDAKKRVKKYLQSEDYELGLAVREWPAEYQTAAQAASLVVERFANPTSPGFTPEELEPLGLTVEEFRSNYVASLMLPWEPLKLEELGYPSLVLTRRPEWESMREMFNRLHDDRSDTDQISPEECLLKIDIDNEHIVLTVEQILEFLPEPEEWAGTELSENTFLSVHLPRMTLPVTLGFFDRSLFTPELHERWPFLTEDAGL
jgi:RNA polymerase sigma factor (sigma-70 family)